MTPEPPDEVRCACGRPLHYDKPETQAVVESLVAKFGPTTIVEVPGLGSYRVQRHYIALHGLRAIELPQLLLNGIVHYP